MGRVVVVGSVNVDYVVRVSHLPRPGETVGSGVLSVLPGGKGANQAHAAARLGAATVLVAALGTDQAAGDERAALAADGADTSELVTCDGPSGIAVILVDEAGENMIAVAPGANDRLGAEHVGLRLPSLLDPASVVLASLEIPLPAVAAAAGAGRDAAATVIINPAPGMPLPPEVLKDVILTPNEGEIRLAAPDAGTEEAAIAAVLSAGARAVVVTRGSRGATLHQAGQAVVTVPAPRVEVVDSVGAGDAFNGALAAALADGATLAAGLQTAVAAGAAACTGSGARAALPTPADLAPFLAATRAAG
ncbi:MAG TPA: PfkB family carbohydrate kinase [Streptosporangiaceae bacterium]|nr:PfkB family carbohydrate kinase [Streptosporangiaceae bacterium]